MQRVVWSLSLALLLAACATVAEKDRMDTIHSQYDAHCREHSREMVGEVDEEARFKECMTYFYLTDVDCPICENDPHLSRTQKF